MPEGDTIYRTAELIRGWLVGRTITAARTTSRAPVERLVGQTVDDVEARAKHLLIRFTGNLTLHTHMKMTGAWRTALAAPPPPVMPTPTPTPTRTPTPMATAATTTTAPERQRQAQTQTQTNVRLVLEAGDHIAICTGAPVVELLDRRAEHLHPALANLGPDVLTLSVTLTDDDLDEVRRRARSRPGTTTIGNLLLDQGVVSGIGNIWRCETLFVERVDPWQPVTNVADDTLDALVRTAARLMGASARSPNGRRPEPYVYGRTNRPCRRCRTPIRAARSRTLGGRTVYWCPGCQQRRM